LNEFCKVIVACRKRLKVFDSLFNVLLYPASYKRIALCDKRNEKFVLASETIEKYAALVGQTVANVKHRVAVFAIFV